MLSDHNATDIEIELYKDLGKLEHLDTKQHA